MLSTSVANSVRVASSRVTSSRLLVRLGLQLGRRRFGGGNGSPGRLLSLSNDRGGLRLALPLRLVDELLRQEKCPLQRLVGQGVGLATPLPLPPRRQLLSSLSAAAGAARLSRSSWAMRSLAWRRRSLSWRT